MTLVTVAGLAMAAGVGSALLPLVNAEAYAVFTAASATAVTVATVVVALSVGQTIGKVMLFETARRGKRWLPRRRPPRSSRARRRAARTTRWTERVAGMLRSDRTGAPVVLAAATVGVPPLAIVSMVAGAAGQRRRVFVPLCLLGRLARFTVLVLPAVALGT
ncbi:MAG: VTT domain-containing protein [Nocardioides sp.]